MKELTQEHKRKLSVRAKQAWTRKKAEDARLRAEVEKLREENQQLKELLDGVMQGE